MIYEKIQDIEWLYNKWYVVKFTVVYKDMYGNIFNPPVFDIVFIDRSHKLVNNDKDEISSILLQYGWECLPIE